jgi:hypothetical protein
MPLLVLEFLALAFALFGDGWLIRRAYKSPEDRLVCALAAVIVSAIVLGIGFVTLVTLALERCGNDCFA